MQQNLQGWKDNGFCTYGEQQYNENRLVRGIDVQFSRIIVVDIA